MTNAVTLIGMDLGTFRTSVVSSNGLRAELETVVGWPRDHIARSVVGKERVFGQEVWKLRTALDVVRPFSHGILKFNSHSEHGVTDELVKKHKVAAQAIVAHAVSLTEPARGSKLYGVIGVPSRATLLNKQVIIEAARDAFDVVMLAPEPFTIAYSMNQLIDTLVVDIGAGTIDLCPMFGTFPTEDDQVTIPFGGDSIDEEFYQRVVAGFPDARISMKMAREIKERYGFVQQSKERVVVTLPVRGKPTKVDVTELLEQSCVKIVAPIVEGIAGLVARFEPEIQQALLGNIVLGGGGSQLKDLDRIVEQALEPYGGAHVTRVYDSVFAGAAGALKIAMAMPEDYWRRLKLVASPADGLALHADHAA